MAALWILIRRKGSKRVIGVIPSKTSSRTKLESLIKRTIKKGFTASIVQRATIERMLNKTIMKKLLNKSRSKKRPSRIKKKKIRRRKK